MSGPARALGVPSYPPAQKLEATYQTPLENHVMIGPTCAIADVRSDGSVTIHSATEYPVITSVISS